MCCVIYFDTSSHFPRVEVFPSARKFSSFSDVRFSVRLLNAKTRFGIAVHVIKGASALAEFFFLLFLIIIKHFINRNNLLCFSDFPFKIFTNAKRLERARAVKLNGSLFFQKKIKRGKAETKQKAICVVMRIRMRMRIFSPTPTENPASTLIVLRNVLFSALSWLFIFLVIPKNYFIMFFFLLSSSLCFWFRATFVGGRCISKDVFTCIKDISYRWKPFFSPLAVCEWCGWWNRDNFFYWQSFPIKNRRETGSRIGKV